jgi:DNA-directed RNA polymerase subunit N (RpoN/RPB10)
MFDVTAQRAKSKISRIQELYRRNQNKLEKSMQNGTIPSKTLEEFSWKRFCCPTSLL